MSESPKLPWFQIHLSTAFVLMFVAGGLMAMNFCGGSRFTPNIFNAHYEGWDGEYGWPIGFNSLEAPEHISFIIDLGVNIVVFVLCGYLCEQFVRRREAREQSGRCLPPP